MEEFVIPSCKDDLTNKNSEQYFVKNIYPITDLDSQLTECKTYLNESGEFFILENFDVFFSILLHFKKLPEKLKDRTWSLLMLAFQKLPFSIKQMFEGSDQIDEEVRIKMLNCIKMLSYLVVEFLNNKCEKIQILPQAKGRKKIESNDNSSWEEQRFEAYIIMYNLLSEKLLIRFWKPPVPEDDFINLLSNCCYKFLENDSISLNKFKTQREKCFQILGLLIKNYNHGFSSTIRLIELLKTRESIINIVAQGIAIIVNDYSCPSLVRELLLEIIQNTQNDIAQDKGNTKTFGTFLNELTCLLPDIILDAVKVLIPLLEEESHYMRIAVLDILKIMVETLSGDNLNDDQKKQRQEFLSLIENQLYDSNSWVRTRVLKIWQDLLKDQRLPTTQYINNLEKCVDRLVDKSSNVRKASMQFLTIFLQKVPFKIQNNFPELIEKLSLEQENLNSLIQEEIYLNGPSALKFLEIEDEIIKAVKKTIFEGSSFKDKSLSYDINDFSTIFDIIKNKLENKEYDEACFLFQKTEELVNTDKSKLIQTDDAKIAFMIEGLQKILFQNEDVHISHKRSQEIEEEIKKRKFLIKYIEDNISFNCLISKAVDIVSEMLDSSTQTDVIEAIDFIVTAVPFEIEAIDHGMVKILSQIWSKDQAIRDAVLRAYRQVYLEAEFNNSRQYASYVVENLTKLIFKVSHNQFQALKLLLQNWVNQDILHKSCFQLMWERFTLSLPNVTEEESRASLVLLGMVASFKPQIIEINLPTLINIGFGPRGEKSFQLVSDVCNLLIQLPQKTVDGKWKKYPKDHEIFNFIKIITNRFTFKDNTYYTRMINQGVKVIYLFAEEPMIIAENLIKNLHAQLGNSQNPDKNNETKEIDLNLLSRFIFTIGEITLCQGIFLENDLLQELKIQKKLNNESKDSCLPSQTNSSPSVNSPRALQINQELRKKRISLLKTPKVNSSQNNNSNEDEGVVSNCDLEADFVMDICENDLFESDRILSFYLDFLLGICLNPKLNSISDLILQTSYSLGKIMSISIKICKKCLPLIIRIFQQTKHPKVKSNIIVILGDLAYKYPNEIEKYTNVIYEGLQDLNIKVQINTLLILRDLIFNEMIKIKGQIADIAFCIVHSNIRISDMAKCIFSDLALKGNALYNTLPDIISRLSNRDESYLKEDDYQIIMKYIINLIQKDRHIESLVEKLCIRIYSSYSDQQLNDLIFCLSLLNLTDRAVNKLNENFHYFAEKMQNDGFYIRLQNILQQSSKNSKSSVKLIIEEMEKKMEEFRSKGVEEKEIKSRIIKNKVEDSPKSDCGNFEDLSFSENSEESSEEGEEQEEQEEEQDENNKSTSSREDNFFNKSEDFEKSLPVNSTSNEENISEHSELDESPIIKRIKTNKKQQTNTHRKRIKSRDLNNSKKEEKSPISKKSKQRKEIEK